MWRPTGRRRIAGSRDVLLEMLRTIDDSARVDQNDKAGDVFEIRIYGKHVGFVRLNDNGSLGEWI